MRQKSAELKLPASGKAGRGAGASCGPVARKKEPTSAEQKDLTTVGLEPTPRRTADVFRQETLTQRRNHLAMSPYLMEGVRWFAITKTKYVTAAQAGHTANCQV